MAISAADDRVGLPVLARLVVQVVLAVAVVLLIHGASPRWSAALLVAVIVWSINAYNFMDGSDGMAGGMAVIGFGSYAVDAALIGHIPLAIAAAAVAGAAVGFLVFNFAPARVFMGDAGSAPLGFLAAAMGLLGWEAGVWSGWFPVVVFSPFLTDASLTLLRRLARGERIWLAHKEHLYQRMVAGGLGHTRTAFAAYGLMAIAAGLALALEHAPRGVASTFAAGLAGRLRGSSLLLDPTIQPHMTKQRLFDRAVAARFTPRSAFVFAFDLGRGRVRLARRRSCCASTSPSRTTTLRWPCTRSRGSCRSTRRSSSRPACTAACGGSPACPTCSASRRAGVLGGGPSRSRPT